MNFRRRVLHPLVLTPVLSLSAVAPVRANNIWHVKPNGAGSLSGLNWANAFATVDQALAASSPTADAQGHSDEIWCAEGTYFTSSVTSPAIGFYIDRPLKLYGGFKGTESSVLTRAGSYLNTILDGDFGHQPGTLDNSLHVVSIVSAGSVVIDGFQIRNGAAVGAGVNGAGISSIGTDLDMANCFVQSNTCALSTFIENRGGGLYFTGGATAVFTLRIKNCEFKENHGELGGAIYCDNNLKGEIVSTQFLSNRASYAGGGVCLQGMQLGASTRLDFTNCVFWSNQTDSSYGGGQGGGLYLGTYYGTGLGGNAQLVNCTLADNACPIAPVLGSQAMYISSNSSATIHNSIIYWNNSSGSANPAPITGSATITYSDIEGGWTTGGSHITNADPRFANHALNRLTLTLNPPSPCLDAADYGQLPFDNLDLDGDGITTNEVLPFDLASQARLVDQLNVTDSGVGGHGQSSYQYLDMGAFERP